MGGKKKSEITEEERIVIDEAISAFRILSKLLDSKADELPSLCRLGEEADLELLNGIYRMLGEDNLEYLAQVISMASDSDFRCPK
jgi:hypothetical protein